MSRTLGSILLAAAVIAIQFIPGLGQLATAALTLAITAAGSFLLMPTMKAEVPETAETAIKTPRPPRVSCYGRRRLSGAYTLFTNTTYSVNSDTFAPYALDALAVHEGRMDGVEHRYLGDDKITLSGSGYVQKLDKGAYGGQLVRWYETTGSTPGTANWSEFISKLPDDWTVNHRGDGVVCLGIVWKPVSADEFSERFPQGAAEASIAGRWQWVFDPRDGTQDVSNPDTWKWSENAVLHLLHYRLVREKARRVLGEELPSATALQDAWDLFFEPTRAFWEAAADICDEDVPLKAGGTEKRYRTCFAHRSLTSSTQRAGS